MRIRRTQYEIFWEILSFCRSGRSFTEIINRCDLNSKIGQDHIELLNSNGLLKKTDVDTRILYEVTAKGEEYLLQFEHIYKNLFGSGPEFRL